MRAPDKYGNAALTLTSVYPLEAGSLEGTSNPKADHGLWPALGCLRFVSEAPPCLLAKESQEILAENAVPCCLVETTTSWRMREEAGET